jgi:hypothetical protein
MFSVRVVLRVSHGGCLFFRRRDIMRNRIPKCCRWRPA